MDTNNYCLYIKINDNSYIEKIKSSMNLIKSINTDTLITFLKEINESGEEQNVIEINITGSLTDSIGVYIKHILSAEKKNFKCINSINNSNEITINVKTESICDIFKVMQSNILLTIYMYNSDNLLYIEEQESNKRTICNKIQTIEQKDNMKNPKYCNIKEDNIKAMVKMKSEELSSLLKKRFKKNISTINIKLTKNAIIFGSSTYASQTMNSISNTMDITYPKSEEVLIDIKDKTIEIIESNYLYDSLEFLKNVKSQYYEDVVLLFARAKSNTNDNYIMQFIYTGAGDKLIHDDTIKITVYPCKLNKPDNYDNENQINYND